MDSVFFSYNGAELPESLSWVLLPAMRADSTVPQLQQGSLAELQTILAHARLIVVIPGQFVTIQQVVLPVSRNRRNYVRAVPFALEDELAEDIDDLHFALGLPENQSETILAAAAETQLPAHKQIAIPVVVVRKTLLQAWLEQLINLGLQPDSIIVDTLALPITAEQWAVLLQPDSASVRTGKQSGFSCNPEHLPLMLEATIQDLSQDSSLDSSQDTPPTKILLWRDTAVELKLDLPATIAVEPQAEPVLLAIAANYQRRQSINLLQGELRYRPKRSDRLKVWRIPAALAAVWLLLIFGSQTLLYWQLRQEKQRLESELVQIYRDTFPDARNISRPRLQMEQKLNELTSGSAAGGGSLLGLVSAVADQLTAYSTININNMQFNGTELNIELTVPDLQILETVKNQINQKPGIQADIQSASSVENRVTGRLKVAQL